MSKDVAIVTALALLAAPMALATVTAGVADDNATWGLCQAHDASEQGNESSNGTVHDTPPFQGINESTCENATAPWNGTPGEDRVPEDPPDEDDHPGEDDNPGQDEPGQP